MYGVHIDILFVLAKFLMNFIANTSIKSTKENIIDIRSVHYTSHQGCGFTSTCNSIDNAIALSMLDEAVNCLLCRCRL